MKRLIAFISIISSVFVLTACGAPTATPAVAPPQAAAPTTAPTAAPAKPTEAPKPTTAPAAAPTTAPTTAPTAAAAKPTTAAMGDANLKAKIALWHGWTGTEQETLQAT
ncbi:MAG: hypothetical protein HY326_07300, partial [Chloroflexi bacterium]|nr:hypothetical protein [Chloroflexota bacterium]